LLQVLHMWCYQELQKIQIHWFVKLLFLQIFFMYLWKLSIKHYILILEFSFYIFWNLNE
jgi:hypothetical protein